MSIAPPRGVSLPAAALLAGITAIVCVYLFQSNPGQIHLLGLDHTLNDQAVYIDAARHLASDGMLTSGVYYPSTLAQDFTRNYLYMPGHAVSLFLSMSVLGDSPLAAVAPGLASYLVSIACLYMLGRRLADTRTGIVAAAGFIAFPPFLVYGASAMSEITFLASGASALTAFVFLPSRWRHFAAPLLLSIPFLFRETGAAWLVPMVVLILSEPGATRRNRLSKAAVAVAGTIVVTLVITRIAWLADRPSLLAQNIFGDSFEEKYTDAYAFDEQESLQRHLPAALIERTAGNLESLLRLLGGTSFESICLNLLLWLPLAACIPAWRSMRLRPLVTAWAVMSAGFFLFNSVLYRWDTYIGLRQMLTPAVLGMLVASGGLLELVRHWRSLYRLTAAGIALAVSMALYMEAASRVTEWDGVQAKALRVMEDADLPDEGILIADISLGPVFLYDNPGSGWLIPPANDKTMLLAVEELDIRGIMLFESDPFWAGVCPETLGRLGFTRSRTIEGLILLERSR